MIHKSTVSRSLLFLLITAVSFSFTNLADAAPLQVVARTGQNAIEVTGYTYNGFYRDNANVDLPAPMLAGNLIALFASLRQGVSIPPTESGLWLLNQTGGGRLVARQGQPAPGTESGTVFGDQLNANSFSNVSENGRVFFSDGLSGPAINPNTNSSAWWVGDVNSTTLLVRKGDVAPGATYVGHPSYPNSFGNFLSLVEVRGFNGIEGVDWGVTNTLVSSLPGAQYPMGQTRGAWLKVQENLERTCWSYGIPSELVGQNVFISDATCTASQSGRGANVVVLRDWLGDGVFDQVFNGTTVSNDTTLWRSGPGYENLIARTASPAPGAPSGVVFRFLPSTTALPAVSPNGDVVFWGMLAGPGVTSSNNTGLWKSTSQGVTLFARSGITPAPAAGTGVNFGGLGPDATSGTLQMLNNGDTVFVTGFSGTGVNLGNPIGIYKITANGTHQLIARAGTAYPAFPTGVTIVRTLLPRVMKVTGNDHVMFTTVLSGTNITATNDDVLLRHTNVRGLELIAQEGQQVGNYILKSFLDNGADMQLTDNYYAVVSATFSPASNPNATPRVGLLGVTPTGETQVIAVATYPVELSDGTTPIINSIRVATRGAINTSGKVVFSAQFTATPKDEAVLVASITGATPPACLADFDLSGTVDVADIFSFLSAWFAQSSTADANNNGTIAVDDIFAFLSAWFAGC